MAEKNAQRLYLSAKFYPLPLFETIGNPGIGNKVWSSYHALKKQHGLMLSLSRSFCMFRIFVSVIRYIMIYTLLHIRLLTVLYTFRMNYIIDVLGNSPLIK